MPQKTPPITTKSANALCDPARRSTEACVTFLGSPGAFGQSAGTVEIKETHKSWVFLCGEDVYKLKKPVRNHLQDLSTLGAREENSRNEVRLNRRLAKDIYLGVRAITLSAAGEISIDGEGEAVDWLVHMRRVPDAFLLDHVIRAGKVPCERIEALIDVLADFYGEIEPAGVTPGDYVSGFEEQQEENRRVLSMSQFPLDSVLVCSLLDAFDATVRYCRPLLEARVTSGAVVEGHGDLRPEHVCLTDPPVVIDCLEFSKKLRIVDPFDEITYLGLESSLLGAPELKSQLVEGYAKRSHAEVPRELLCFYETYRALLRARLCLAHLFDPGPQDELKWLRKTEAYIAAAKRALVSLETQ